MARNEYIGRITGNSLGRVEEVDLEIGEIEWGEYMLIRVNIDISKILLRCKKLNIGLSKPVWLRFFYERLPDF